MLTGALGPPSIRAACLTGNEATKNAVVSALEAATSEPAPFYMVYFSGDASGKGLRVADGYVDGGAVNRHFERVTAPSVLFVLEVACGPRPDEDIVPRWVQALAEARPGFRLAATRATRIGGGVEGEGRGRFTAAFLSALATADGDIDFEGARFVSDRRAMEETRGGLVKRWGVTHLPTEMGTFGDFPLARCQAARPVGSAKVLGLAMGKGMSGVVRHLVEGRRGVPTRIRLAMLDATDERLGEEEVTIVPDEDRLLGRTRIRLPEGVLADHVVWGATLELGESVHVRLRVTLLDSRGHVLDQKSYGHEYTELPGGARRG